MRVLVSTTVLVLLCRTALAVPAPQTLSGNMESLAAAYFGGGAEEKDWGPPPAPGAYPLPQAPPMAMEAPPPQGGTGRDALDPDAVLSRCFTDTVTCEDGTVLSRDPNGGCGFPLCPGEESTAAAAAGAILEVVTVPEEEVGTPPLRGTPTKVSRMGDYDGSP
jgi:hypothetical protein